MVGVLEKFYPKPASAEIPKWYKKTDSYPNGQKKPDYDGTTQKTIKKCMPVFDAITTGYIIYSPSDVYVHQRDGEPWFTWAAFSLIEFHNVEQAKLHPVHNGFPYPKFINPWSITTRKGYSCLFLQPLHREAPFKILEGVVDTDTYNAPVNFPFVLTDPKFEGLIPAGTALAQVIPFKRENYKMKIGKEINKKSVANIIRNFNVKFYDVYKTFYWNKKEYK